MVMEDGPKYQCIQTEPLKIRDSDVAIISSFVL